MAVNWGFENGGIVPTDGQYMAQTHAGRMAIASSGTPELIASLAGLRAWTFEQVADHKTKALPRRWGSLLTTSPSRDTSRQRRYTHRVAWVLEGPMRNKAAVIAEAKRVSVENGGRAVLVMLRQPIRRPDKPARSADPWSDSPEPKIEICYRVMLVVPRPTKIKDKNGGRWLDWKPVVVEPPIGKEKAYHVTAIEIYRSPNSLNPDDYRIDQNREIQMLARAAGDLAKEVTKATKSWQKLFVVESAVKGWVARRSGQRGLGRNGSLLTWLTLAAVASMIVVALIR